MQTIQNVGYTKIWGEHSFTIGELVGFAIGFAIIYFHWLGKWSFFLGVAVILLSTILF